MAQAKRRAPRSTSQKRQFKMPRVEWRGRWQAGWQGGKAVVFAWQQRIKSAWFSLPPRHRLAISCIVVVIAILLVLPSSSRTEKSTTTQPPQRQVLAMDQTRLQGEQVARQPVEPEESITPLVQTEWQRYQIQAGDTMAKVFRQHNLAEADLYAIANIDGAQKILGQIQPGQWIRYKQKANGELDALQIEAKQPVMFIRLSNGGFARAND